MTGMAINSDGSEIVSNVNYVMSIVESEKQPQNKTEGNDTDDDTSTTIDDTSTYSSTSAGVISEALAQLLNKFKVKDISNLTGLTDDSDVKKEVLPTVKRVDINFVSEMAIVFNKKMQFFDGFVELFELSKHQFEAK